MPLLTIDHVTQRFGGVIAVSDVSFEIEKGKKIGIIGPNGAGKTTLFNCLTGFYKPTSGNVIFHDTKDINLSKKRVDQITELGFARTFQNIRLFRDLTILDNIKIIGRTNFTADELNHIDAIVYPEKNQRNTDSPAAQPISSGSVQTNSDTQTAATQAMQAIPANNNAKQGNDKTPLVHIEQRYSVDKKGNKVDNFFRAWIMANVQANNDSAIIMKKKASKEYTKFAEELCLVAYPSASDDEKKAFEKEWRAFAREYIHACKTDKAYTTTLFGFVNMNEDDLVNKIISEIETVTQVYPKSIGLEDL